MFAGGIGVNGPSATIDIFILDDPYGLTTSPIPTTGQLTTSPAETNGVITTGKVTTGHVMTSGAQEVSSEPKESRQTVGIIIGVVVGIAVLATIAGVAVLLSRYF